MSVSLESASKFKQQSRATSFPTACAGRVRDRAEYDTGNPGAIQAPRSKNPRAGPSARTGSLEPGQIEILVIVTTTATYSEELAACFEDAQDDQALDRLYNICFRTVKSIKPVTSSQANKEEHYWLALGRLSTALQTTLKALPDGQELLEQILDPLKLANGFEKSAQFANGAHQASRIQFWEMVVAHVETIEEVLQGCSSATQALCEGRRLIPA